MDWWKTLFDQDYLTVYGPLYPPERSRQEVEGVERILGLRPGMRVLDLACGHGRHTLLLAGRGYQAVGLDFSGPFLAHARAQARQAGLPVHWVRGDMRALPWVEAFDAVLCLFTSLGYFEKEEDNLRVVQEVARALRPGGFFLLDLAHRDWLVRNFCRREWFRRGDLWVWEERRFDPVAGRLHVEHYWMAGSRQEKRHFDLRIYTATEAAAMVWQAGLEVHICLGGYDGSPFTGDASRLLLVARRPQADTE